MLSTARKAHTATNLESEMGRLYSFLSWLNAIQPSRLSRNGFYYSGFNHKVVCYKCGIEVDDWTTVDEVLERHRQESPFCTEATTADSHNKLTAVSIGTEVASPVNRRHKDEDDYPRAAAPCSALAAGSYRQTSRNVNVKADDRSNPDFEQLRSESVRLETFHDWPSTAARIVEPRDLVKAGLFYTGHTDRVQCAFCRGFLRAWTRGDKPMDEHRKHFPDCQFIRTETNRLEQTNGRINSQSVSTAAPLAQHTASECLINLTESHEAGVRSNARHHEFSDLSKRVKSFIDKRVGHGQTIEALTKAGFFHVGPEDNVRCFYCDGGLKNWQPTDDPWTEHARWFPRCPFVISQKDKPFIQNAGIAKNNATSQSFGINASSTSFVGGQYSVEPREIKARMDSRTVQNVIKMGYPRDIVRQVIERRLKSTGDDFASTQSLLEAIFEFEDNEEQQTTGSSQQTTAQPQNSTTRDASTTAAAAAATATTITSKKLTAAQNDKQEPLDSEALEAMEENRQLREARTCKVCMDKEVDTVFLPCGHLVCCSNCSPELRNCAVCRALIRGTVKIFLG